MRYIIPVVVVFSLVVYCCSDNPVKSHDYGGGDDYEIYHAALGDNLGSSEVLIILGDSTSTSIMSSDSVNIAYFKEHFPELQDETINDFVSTNKNRIKIKYISGVNHLVLSSDLHDGSNENTVRVGFPESGIMVRERKPLWNLVQRGRLWQVVEHYFFWQRKMASG